MIDDGLLLVTVILLVGVFGLIIGSFLNVVIWRLPRGESLSHPGSACPKCNHAIRWWDNVPVVSWLVLRGRCRDCGNSISWRYPAVETATGVFFAAVGFWVFDGGSRSGNDPLAQALTLIAYLYLAGVSVALTMIDLDTNRLPNALVLPGYIVGVVLLGGSSLLSGDIDSIISAVIGAASLFVAYLLMAIAYPGGMGFGDVKLSGVLGLFLGWLGWGPLLVGAFGAFLLGGIFSVALVVVRRAGRKSGIPFGPWMLAGAWLGIFAGEAVWTGYLALVGLEV